MTEQPRLFYESFEEAAREVINACGGNKAVGAVLWPAKSADAARTRLLDCLNSERSEKLAPEEIIMLARLGRERGCHAIADYMAQETGYEKPIPANPDDERERVQRQFIASAETLLQTVAHLKRIGSR